MDTRKGKEKSFFSNSTRGSGISGTSTNPALVGISQRLSFIFRKKDSTGAVTGSGPSSGLVANGVYNAASIAVAHGTNQPVLISQSPVLPNKPLGNSIRNSIQSQKAPPRALASTLEPDHLDDAINGLKVALLEAQAKRSPYADRIAAILRCLNEYTIVVDIAIQSNPSIASLIWAGIRGLLKVSLEYFEYLDHMEFMITTVVDKMIVCQFYDRIYTTAAVETVLERDLSKRAMQDNLKNALTSFYQVIQKFVKMAVECLEPSLVEIIFLPFVRKLKPLLEEMKMKEDEMRLYADLATMKRVMENSTHLKQIQHVLDDIKKNMRSLENLNEAQETALTTIFEAVQDNMQSNAEVKGIATEILHRVQRLENTYPQKNLTLSFDVGFNLLDGPRKSHFVERESLLGRLESQINDYKNREETTQFVLHGTGGMGKTQLALQYVYRHRNKYSSVFWVNAATIQTLNRDFTSIMRHLIQHHICISNSPDPGYTRTGQLLGIAGKMNAAGALNLEKGDEEHVVKAVKRYFENSGNTKWLLVFDNYDDVESVFIDEYIPECNHGTILITTRRPQCVSGRKGIEIDQMTPSEAESLLLKSAGYSWSEITDPQNLSTEQVAVKTLIEDLGYVPLAIDQAGAYIKINSFTFSHYLEKYKSNITEFLKINSKLGKNEKSIFASWELSFEAIQKQNPPAAELLLVCGFLANDNISEELLRRGMALARNDLSLDKSINSLLSYSLVKRSTDKDNQSFSIHPLVHEWAHRRLTDPQCLAQKVMEAFILVTTAIRLPPDAYKATEDWIFERRIMSHTSAVEGYIQRQDFLIDKPELLSAVTRWAGLCEDQGHYELSLKWLTKALDAGEKALELDPNHEDLLEILHSIGNVYFRQSQYDKALEFYKRALSGRERVLGPDHSQTLQTVRVIGSVFNNQKQHDLAFKWFNRALAGFEKAFGDFHPATLRTVNCIAVFYDGQRKYDLAREWYNRALEGYEKTLGTSHPDYLRVARNLAYAYQVEEKYDLALEWLERALEEYEKTVGIFHHESLSTVYAIASVYQKHKNLNLKAALEWFNRALEKMEKSFGPDHEKSLKLVQSIGYLFETREKYEEALLFDQRALNGYEKSLGPEHEKTLDIVNNIGNNFFHRKKHEEALSCYQRALRGYERCLGPEHEKTLDIVNNIGNNFSHRNRLEEALSCYQRALRGYESCLGPEHEKTLDIANNIGCAFFNRRKYEEALPFFQRALSGFEKCLGPGHKKILVAMESISRIYSYQNIHDEALKWYTRLLTGREQILGSEHPHTLLAMYNIGITLYNREQWDEALDILKRCFAGQEKALGVSNKDTLYTIYMVLLTYKAQVQLDEAMDWFEPVFNKLLRASFDDQQVSVQKPFNDIVELLDEIGHPEKADELWEYGLQKIRN